MRVMLDGRVQAGGVGRYGRALHQALAQLDDRLEVQLLDQQGRLTWRPFTPWARRAVARSAQNWSADVVHGLHLETPRSGIPTIVTIHDLIPLEHPKSMPSAARRLVFRRLVDHSLRLASRVIVPSQLTADSLIARGAEASQLEVVPMGVDSVFSPVSADEAQSARRRFAGGRRYIATIAGHASHKNFEGLLRAAEILNGSLRAPIVCLGTGVRSAPHNLVFSGRLSDRDLRALYAGADVFLLPSLVEGFGFPLVEAAACGTAVVCGRRVGALEQLGGHARQVDVGDPAAMAKAVERLWHDEDERSHLADGVRAAAKQLTVSGMARRTLDIYSLVVA